MRQHTWLPSLVSDELLIGAAAGVIRVVLESRLVDAEIARNALQDRGS
jgi:hypothetical protein